jgi:hypothetical protein
MSRLLACLLCGATALLAACGPSVTTVSVDPGRATLNAKDQKVTARAEPLDKEGKQVVDAILKLKWASSDPSVATVAVELAETLFHDLSGREVLVVGAGDMSEKTARALRSRGARSLLVSNRSFDRAAVLAAELGGRAIRFEDWEQNFPGVDIVIADSAADFAAATEALWRDQSGRQRLGAAGRALIERQYRWEQIAPLQAAAWRAAMAG